MKRLNQLLDKLNNDSCSIEELEELKQLLGNDKLTQKYFNKQYKSEVPKEIDKVISKNLWQAIDSEIKSKPTGKLKRIKIKRFIGIAASVVLLMSIGLLNWPSKKNKQWVFVQNTSHEVKKITLPDSSHVWLSSQSSLSYAPTFNTSQRETKLTGQAFFEVTKNPNSSFTIQTGEVLTKVLGTSFNIKSKDTLVEVVVATGLVKVSSQKEAVELLPNQKVVYNANLESLQKTNTLGQLHTLWVKNTVVLDSISINQLVPVLEEKYNKPIVFRDEKAKSVTLYSFRLNSKESLEQVIKRINYINEVQLKLNNNMIEITTK
ncbi:FecR family protein [Winogradskyella sp.]|uniref:FecR family protein n=1 Tax=Winogradskyella sp. TaxID=1883156 RepID=UPI00261C6CB9|nr:FecR family protein [Winogradskyella sp.]